MSARSILFGSAAPSRGTDAALLLLRLGFFLPMAFLHGLGKLPPSEGFIGGTAALGFPLPVVFAWAAGLSEFLGGLLLAAGLLTRPAAGLLAFTMAVAFFGAHGAALSGDNSGEMALLYLVASVVVLVAGPGLYSVDARLSGRAAARV